LRAARAELGLSQEALAARAEINTSYLSQIERGRKAPSVDVLARLAAAVNLPVAELFASQDSPTLPLHAREVEQILADVPQEQRATLLDLIRAAADLARR
jgi:transcriptional regulator with XRE-family HTH domain